MFFPNFRLQIKAPANSPDLNPIDWLWQDLKTYVRSKFCETEEEAALAVGEFMRKLTAKDCKKYIDKLKEVKTKIYQY